MGKAFINIGGFILPGVAGYLGYSLLWVAAWSFVFSLITASKSFRAFAGLQAPPDTSSARYSMTLVRWVFCLVLMLVAYAIGWGIARLI